MNLRYTQIYKNIFSIHTRSDVKLNISKLHPIKNNITGRGTGKSFKCRFKNAAKICLYWKAMKCHIYRTLIWFFFSFWTHLWHVVVPRLGIQPASQNWPKLQQWQNWILNLLSHRGAPWYDLLILRTMNTAPPLTCYIPVIETLSYT